MSTLSPEALLEGGQSRAGAALPQARERALVLMPRPRLHLCAFSEDCREGARRGRAGQSGAASLSSGAIFPFLPSPPLPRPPTLRSGP